MGEMSFVKFWSAPADRAPRILLVRLGAMGDVIQTLPVASALKRRFPESFLAWAVEGRWSPLLDSNPHVDSVIEVPLKTWRRNIGSLAAWRRLTGCLSSLRGQDFDLALDCQGLVKSASLARASGAVGAAGLARDLLREPVAESLYDWRVPTDAIHVVDRYLRLASFASGMPVSQKPEFPIPEGTIQSFLPDRYLLASPQAGWGSKQWPTDHYARLVTELWHRYHMPMALDCAPGGTALADEIATQTPPGATICHESTLPQLIGATRKAVAVVGVDSGPMHLAAALGKPGAAIFGPTDPQRNGPYGGTMTMLRTPDAETTYRRDLSPAAAMHACHPDQVIEALEPILESSAPDAAGTLQSVG